MSIAEINRPKLIHQIYPGVVGGCNNLITSNSKFFAYSTIISVYVYSQKPTIRPVNVITEEDTICTISLAAKKYNLIAISYATSTVKIIHIENNDLVSSFSNDLNIISIGWQNNDQELICFTNFYNHYFIYDVNSGTKLYEQTGEFGNLRVMTINYKTDPPIMIGGNRRGTVTKICGDQARTYEFENRGPVYSVCLDPFSEENCLILWKTHWALYTVGDVFFKNGATSTPDSESKKTRSPRRYKFAGAKSVTDITLINECGDSSYNFSAAAWSTTVIGQFFTSDYCNGNIRIWTCSSHKETQIIKIDQTGIEAILSMKSDCLLVSFTDGTIGVYDIVNRCFLLKNQSGHLNSIFSIQNSPMEKSTIVSCSGEGHICLYNLDEMQFVQKLYLPINNQIGHILTMKISPGGGYLICGHSRGFISIYSLELQKVISVRQLNNSGVYHLDYHSEKPELLLISFLSNNFCLFDISSFKVLYTLPNSYTGYFAKFLNSTEIVSCGKNSLLKISFDNQGFQNTHQIVQLQHNDKKRELFALGWSKPDIILSIDNSGDLILWDLNKSTNRIIYSDFGKLRSINFLLDNFVIVAGFKGILTIIDLNTENIVLKYQAHSKHIFAIEINNYVLITGSIDSSIKFWSIENLFKDTILLSLINFNSNHENLQLMNTISKLPDQDEITLVNHFSNQMNSINKFLKLVNRCAKQKKLTFDFEKDIIHINDIITISKSFQQQNNSTKETPIIKRAIQTKEKILQNAHIELFQGNPRRYCELLFYLGEYDAAISMAPTVSVEFWKELIQRKIELTENKNEICNYHIAIGEIDDAIDDLLEADQFDMAFLLASSEQPNTKIIQSKSKKRAETELNEVQQENLKNNVEYIDQQFMSNDKFFEYQLASLNSKKYLEKGQIFIAAASYLSIGDIVQCERLLATHGQLPLAFYFDQKFNINDQIVKEKFSLLCISLGIFDVFSVLSKQEKERVVISMNLNTNEERDNFYKKIDLESIESYSNQLPSTENSIKRLHLLLLAGQIDNAVSFYLDFAKTSNDFMILKDMTKLIEIANLDNVSNIQFYSVVFFSMYFAFYESVYRNYKMVSSHFFGKLSLICKKYLNNDEFFVQKMSEIAYLNDLVSGSSEESRIYTIGYSFLNEKPLGTPYLSMTMYGNIFTLDDEKTPMTMEEALMWFNLCPFSPLLTKVKTYIY